MVKIITKFLLFIKAKYYHPIKKISKVKIVTEEFECCVICGKLTTIPKSTPVELRKDYVVGCGQVCTSCKEKLHI